ncbi:MAG: LicD family protein [Eubacterium sp.]|nr:LicD family protein [Candidatus Colimonas fimequi]
MGATWTSKQFEILCKLNNICQAQGINLYLFGDTALAAYRDKTLSDNVSVCIDAADVSRFINAVEDSLDEHLLLEGMHNNGRYPKLSLRAYDPETIDFNVANYLLYDNNCIHVDVEIIKHIPSSKIKRTALDLDYGLYKDSRKELLAKSKKASGKKALVKNLLMKRMHNKEAKCGADTFAKEMFFKLINGYASDEKKVEIDKFKLSSSMFKKTTTVEIDGVSFLIPQKSEQYIQKVSGFNWINAETKAYSEDDSKFREVEFSWAQYKGRIEGILPDEYFDLLKKSNSLGAKHQKYHKKITDYYKILKRTDVRIKLWKKYSPIRDEIIELLGAGKYEELETVLSDYIDALREFADMKLGLSFDPDIFMAAKQVLVNKGESEAADYMESLIPQAHKKPLRIKNYKGEYIN